MNDTFDINLMTTTDVAVFLQLSPRTLEDWRRLKKGPKWRYVGVMVRYRMSDIQTWIDSLRTVVKDGDNGTHEEANKGSGKGTRKA